VTAASQFLSVSVSGPTPQKGIPTRVTFIPDSPTGGTFPLAQRIAAGTACRRAR